MKPVCTFKEYEDQTNYICTLILELGFSMMYLMAPCMFSVQDTSHVTLLSCLTSFHFVPGGGLGY